jgi:hypothetical protein
MLVIILWLVHALMLEEALLLQEVKLQSLVIDALPTTMDSTNSK